MTKISWNDDNIIYDKNVKKKIRRCIDNLNIQGRWDIFGVWDDDSTSLSHFNQRIE